MRCGIPFLFTLLALATGCASSRIGPEATFVDADDQRAPPLNVSAAFRSDLCSPQIGHLSFSVENPHNSWRVMKNIQLLYPYSNQNSGAFEVLTGDRLIAWADAIERKYQRESHNANLARLAAFSLSGALMLNNNEDTRKAGAGLAVAVAGAEKAGSIDQSASAASKPAGDNSNHLLTGEKSIPPGMDRTFWVLLNARPDAPLMSWIGVRYQDEQGENHEFVAPLPQHQKQCSWQQERVRFLQSWALEHDMIDYRDRSENNIRLSPVQIEEAYQQQLRLSGSD